MRMMPEEEEEEEEERTNRRILTRVSSLAGNSQEAKTQLLVDGVNDFPCL